MMNEENNNYRKIGILAVLIFTAAFMGYKSFKRGHFDRRVKLYSIIEDASLMEAGVPVLTRGLKIGEVRDLYLVDSGVLLELVIHEGFKINKSAQFYTGMSGPLGGRIIEVKGLEESNDFYINGDTIHSKFNELSIREGVDSTMINGVEPSLKELSRTVGKILQEYGESPKK